MCAPNRESFTQRDGVKLLIGCELRAFNMGVRPKNANLNVTLFVSRCIANGTYDI
jgi:hypothetical protein